MSLQEISLPTNSSNSRNVFPVSNNNNEATNPKNVPSKVETRTHTKIIIYLYVPFLPLNAS